MGRRAKRDSLSASDVTRMRELYWMYHIPTRRIAQRFGVSQETVARYVLPSTAYSRERNAEAFYK